MPYYASGVANRILADTRAGFSDTQSRQLSTILRFRGSERDIGRHWSCVLRHTKPTAQYRTALPGLVHEMLADTGAGFSDTQSRQLSTVLGFRGGERDIGRHWSWALRKRKGVLVEWHNGFILSLFL